MTPVDSTTFQIDDGGPHRLPAAVIKNFSSNARLAYFLSVALGWFLCFCFCVKFYCRQRKGREGVLGSWPLWQVAAKDLFKQSRRWFKHPQKKMAQVIYLLVLPERSPHLPFLNICK